MQGTPHRAARCPLPGPPGLLSAGAGLRLAVASVVVLALWLAVAWALV
ncbi:MAG: hypothetical protein Q8M01_20870 [Rubrivivax sp.]|nr:hypothetical protein [Rubrivivax sp.]